jgi:hypothetical protein
MDPSVRLSLYNISYNALVKVDFIEFVNRCKSASPIVSFSDLILVLDSNKYHPKFGPLHKHRLKNQHLKGTQRSCY